MTGAIGVVMVTEAQQTQRLIMLLIAVLIAVAVLLLALTLWYWRHTNPRRYVRQLFPEPRGSDLDLRQRYAQGVYPGAQPGRVVLEQDAYDPYRHGGDPYADPRYPTGQASGYDDDRWAPRR